MQENNIVVTDNETAAQTVEQADTGAEANVVTETETVTHEELKAADPHANFNPVTYLIEALTKAGHPKPAAWTQDIDLRAHTAEKVEDRIFFANRALRLYISEHLDMENITPRMILAEGIAVSKWIALMEQGAVKWLMGKFKKVEEKKENLGEVQDTQAASEEASVLADKINSPAPESRTINIAGGITLPEGIDPENFPQSFDGQRTQINVKLDENDPDPHKTVENIVTATAAQATETEGAVTFGDVHEKAAEATIDSKDVATNVFSPEGELKEVVVTAGDADASVEGSMDSLPGSIIE